MQTQKFAPAKTFLRAPALFLVTALWLGLTGAAVVAKPFNKTEGKSVIKIKTKNIEYKEGSTVLEGFLAYNEAQKGPRPAVIVVHDWLGVGPNVKRRAEQLAELGYVAFAADIYGKGVRPQGPEEAMKAATVYKGNRPLARARAQAAYDFLLKHPNVDTQKVAIMGYCFGGMVALELGRAGAPLRGIVSFHGSLDSPTSADAKNIKGKVLVLHGADDPYVPKEQVQAFTDEMRSAQVDWQMIQYGGAVHAFAVPDAGSDTKTGAAYNASADRRSWSAMQAFFGEIFN